MRTLDTSEHGSTHKSHQSSAAASDLRTAPRSGLINTPTAECPVGQSASSASSRVLASLIGLLRARSVGFLASRPTGLSSRRGIYETASGESLLQALPPTPSATAEPATRLRLHSGGFFRVCGPTRKSHQDSSRGERDARKSEGIRRNEGGDSLTGRRALVTRIPQELRVDRSPQQNPGEICGLSLVEMIFVLLLSTFTSAALLKGTHFVAAMLTRSLEVARTLREEDPPCQSIESALFRYEVCVGSYSRQIVSVEGL